MAKILVLPGIALLLAACGGAGQAPASSTAPSASSIASSQTAGEGATLQAIVDGARKEGAIQLVWGGGAVGAAEGARMLGDGLNKRYGLNLAVNFSLGPSMPDMGAKILQEFQTNHPASSDIMLGSEAHFPPLMQAKALEPVNWTAWSDTIKDPKLLGQPGGTSVKIASRTPGITYNTDRIKGPAIPHSLQDLLKPEYKGQIASTVYAAMFDRIAAEDWWGEAKTVDYLTKLSGQVSGLIRCGENERIASGEFPIFALDCGSEDALRGKAQGAPLAQVIPADTAALVYWYMGVPKNAAHPNAAKLFIDYLMSREGQDILWKTSWDDQWMLPGSHVAQAVDQLKSQGVTFREVDIDFVLQHDPARTDRVRQELQNILAKKA
jgi:ABC-type Fe3+ transport system substrate-binding protein